MKDIRWTKNLLAYRHIVSWLIVSYGGDGITLINLAAEAQSWVVARALLACLCRWHRRGALTASPETVKAMICFIRAGGKPGRLLDYLYREGDGGALLLIKCAHLAGKEASHFSSGKSLRLHHAKHGSGISEAEYLERARSLESDHSTKTFLAYHVIAGRCWPRVCRFSYGRRLFVAINASGHISTCFTVKKSLRAFLENENIASVLLVR